MFITQTRQHGTHIKHTQTHKRDFIYYAALPLNIGVSIKTFYLNSTQCALKYA